MSKEVECPCCLGTGQEILSGKHLKVCSLCKGKGIVKSALAEDYISNINVNLDGGTFFTY